MALFQCYLCQKVTDVEPCNSRDGQRQSNHCTDDDGVGTSMQRCGDEMFQDVRDGDRCGFDFALCGKDRIVKECRIPSRRCCLPS